MTAWGKVGEHYAERGKWGKAVPFFKQAKNLEMMAECFYRFVVVVVVVVVVLTLVSFGTD